MWTDSWHIGEVKAVNEDEQIKIEDRLLWYRCVDCKWMVGSTKPLVETCPHGGIILIDYTEEVRKIQREREHPKT